MTHPADLPRLESFGEPMTVVVFGAGGGVGGGLVERLAAHPRVRRVFAGRRGPAGDAGAGGKVTTFRFDLTDEASIAEAAALCAADGPPDLVIVATGVLHDGASLRPEKTWRSLTPENLALAFAINAVGPAMIAKHMLGLLPRDRKAVFAALSARVGSIGDNRLGGWHAYRASKAALNMIIKTLSVELALRNPSAVCAALHPGTVDTALSKPFRAGASADAPLTPVAAATHLLAVIDRLTPSDSGGCFAWDGSRIPA